MDHFLLKIFDRVVVSNVCLAIALVYVSPLGCIRVPRRLTISLLAKLLWGLEFLNMYHFRQLLPLL